ncbi:MAG: hypothetical protein ACKOTB_04595, partial [Planctomycetia bacterium]
LSSTLGPISKAYARLCRLRSPGPQVGERELKFNRRVSELFADRVVRNGPFKGMRYPGLTAIGSSLYPKLLGSYERELTPAIASIIRTPYTAIVDIGCAEGYYAVGLGMHLRNAKVFAFDTSPEAQRLCREMAELNGVAIHTGGFCDSAKLLELDLGEHALVFCDCEGYENDLIDEHVARALSRHDFCIETHDFIRLDTTERLSRILGETHDCELYESMDDILKAYRYDDAELLPFDLRDRLRLVAEGRPQIMRWIYARSRTRESAAKMPADR